MIELLSGLLLLIAGAELMVRAAVRLAARLHVRPLIIGLTIVALSSSAPQMAVSLQATLAQNADIAVGSVIGSSIFNILVTLGLSALIIPLRVSRQLVRLDIPLMIGASLLVFVLAWNEELNRARRHDSAGRAGAVPGLAAAPVAALGSSALRGA